MQTSSLSPLELTVTGWQPEKLNEGQPEKPSSQLNLSPWELTDSLRSAQTSRDNAVCSDL